MIVDILVIKIASRCNLNCTYCYVYNAGDNTYLKQPKLMSLITVDKIIDRVLEHCILNNVKNYLFIFHGGEPMLQKKSFFYHFVNQATKKLTKEHKISCRFAIQSNGVLFDEEWCKVFNELKIAVGISLDGIKEVNDKYRVDHQNKGTYNRTIKGFLLAQKKLKINPGILSVIDIDSHPEITYKHLKKLNVENYDLKWPYASHDTKPNTKSSFHFISSKTPYADWLIKFFDLWFQEKKENKARVRIFETIISLILGSDNAGNEDFGLRENKVLCIQTNGDLEAVGALNLCGNGFTKSNANINEYTFSEALETKLAKVYHNSHKKLNKKCLKCPINDLCGGGHIVTRFSKKNGFDNVSVYCKDYMKLFSHIQNKVYDSLPEQYKIGYDKIDYHELESYMENISLDEIENPNYFKELANF